MTAIRQRAGQLRALDVGKNQLYAGKKPVFDAARQFDEQIGGQTRQDERLQSSMITHVFVPFNFAVEPHQHEAPPPSLPSFSRSSARS